MAMACEAESAILKMSGADAFLTKEVGFDRGASLDPEQERGRLGEPSLPTGKRLELLTEIKIKEKVLSLLGDAEPGARIDLSMFYLSNRDVIHALIRANQRGCSIRIILDPAKDAFGRIKNGIPNRQSGAVLVKAGIPLRWADTHGEQCHVKALYVEHADSTATLLLGSCNYTRRNMENYNCECDLALTASVEDENMQRACEVFERWWSNPEGRSYTVGYETFEDRSLRRRFRAWLIERTGMGTF